MSIIVKCPWKRCLMQCKQGDMVPILQERNLKMINKPKRTFKLNGVELPVYRDWETDRKSTRLNSSHSAKSRMPSSA